MSWKFKPVSLLKSFATGLSVVTMCIAPVAQGAAKATDNKKRINQYLKETGLTTKKMTVGEYWRMVRHVYPSKLQKQMDQWVALNHKEMMPSIEATSFKDANGKEQVRLTLTKDGQSGTLTFTGDEDTPLKVNGVPFSKNELSKYNNFSNVAAKYINSDKATKKNMSTGQLPALGKDFALTYQEYKRLTLNQKAEYHIRLRRAMDSAQKVYEYMYGVTAANELNSAYEWVFQAIIGSEAQAQKKKKNLRSKVELAGSSCIVAGYVSVYGENGSCGGDKAGKIDLTRQMSVTHASCSGGGVGCNPIVYGFKDGNTICVPKKEVRFATSYCNKQSPLDLADKKRIVESWIKKETGKDIDLKINGEGKIPDEQRRQKEVEAYFAALQTYVNKANFVCDNDPNLQKIREKYPNVNEDQGSACIEIKDRAFSLQGFITTPEPAPTNPDQFKTCPDKKPGSQPGKKPDECICPEGMEDKGTECVAIIPIVTGGEIPGGKEPVIAEDSCGFWCRNKNWIIPVGIIGVGAGLLWWLLSKDSKAKTQDPVYVPPAPVPDPGTNTQPVTPPPVDPPPPAPPACPDGHTNVNGICIPPVVVEPPVSNEGGSKQDGDIPKGGAVRKATQ